MTMTKNPSQKTCDTYGHGPLKFAPEEEKNDDRDQDSLKKVLLHIWSRSSETSFSFSGGSLRSERLSCPTLHRRLQHVLLEAAADPQKLM